VDPALIPLYERAGRTHRGRALETVVLLELGRRGYTSSWLRVGDDWEVDFFAERPGEPALLVQICLDADSDRTWQRAVRSLIAAAERFPDAQPILLTLNSTLPRQALPAPLIWHSAAAWLLTPEPAGA
jgi:predicted AAA+ superfamily ATPase